MADLSKKQQLKLIDLVETFVDRSDIHDDLLADASVVHQFLMMSKNQSAVVFAFVNLLNRVDLPAHVYPIRVAENNWFLAL